MKKFVIVENFFELINSELKAYLLGYFLADGYVTIEHETRKNPNYRLGINVSIDDYETAKLLSDSIFVEDKVIKEVNYKSDGVNRKPQLIVRWTSYKMQKDLEKLGIKRAKTKDLTFSFDFNLIPKDLHRHFIRGFFDGDGCVSLTTQNCFDWSFIFTSEIFCNQIAEILEDRIPGLNRKIYSQAQSTMTTYLLRFNSSNMKTLFTKLFYDYLYSNSNFYLSRKKKKFEDYFQHRGISEWALGTQITVERR